MPGPASSVRVAPDVARRATGARRAWAACVTAACSLFGSPPSAAQVTGTLDIGVSTVRYDGFLPSGAAAVTPAVRWNRPAGVLTVSGTYLRFESGHRTLQALLAGSLLTPPGARPWRGDLAVSAAASRYTTDAISGTSAGRYPTAALRLRTAVPRRLVTHDAAALAHRGADGGTAPPAARLQVQSDRGGLVRLVVQAAGATRVELAADFTDWQPLALTRRADGMWEAVLQIASGLHRVNVRIDGAAWLAPAGITRAADEYGSEVGIFAVP